MAYEFKKLSDVEVVAEPTESANVLIEEDGVIKKAPKSAVGGGNSSGAAPEEYDLDVLLNGGTVVYLTGDYNVVSDKLLNGSPVKCRIRNAYPWFSQEYMVVYVELSEYEYIDLYAYSKDSRLHFNWYKDNSFTQRGSTDISFID